MTRATGAPGGLRIRPTDLAGYPEVDRLLAALGLGRMAGDLEARPGRNENWSGTTSSGARVFVKRLGRDERDGLPRMQRADCFEHALAGRTRDLNTPPYLGRQGSFAAWDLLPDGRTGLERVLDEDFDEPAAREAGTAIAALHDAPVPPAADAGPPPLPPLPWLEALPWELYLEASAGALELWRLVHGDPSLVGDIRAIRVREDASPRVPAHCDLRLDQLLWSGGVLFLTDWEDFRVADPARDVGSFAGEWLHRAVTALPATVDTGDGGDPAVAEAELVERAVGELDRVRPQISAFWDAYRRRREPDPGLAVRATALVGWHLFERLLAGTQEAARLAPTQRAAAGIGRSLLAQPEHGAALIGLEDPR